MKNYLSKNVNVFVVGDKAMRSLGNSVGSIGASICNFLEYFGQMAQNSPTAYG